VLHIGGDIGFDAYLETPLLTFTRKGMLGRDNTGLRTGIVGTQRYNITVQVVMAKGSDPQYLSNEDGVGLFSGVRLAVLAPKFGPVVSRAVPASHSSCCGLRLFSPHGTLSQ
jgi:hypothetical protein